MQRTFSPPLSTVVFFSTSSPLNNILPKLPKDVSVELGRDETAVGWVFEYALVDTTGQHNLAELRSLQDWRLRYELQSLPLDHRNSFFMPES